MAAVMDRVIRDAGTPESEWLPWLSRQAISRVSANDLCPDAARLVVVAPHPDDEILACGGLLAMRAALDLPCLVFAVTDGSASHGTADAQACARLGARRAEESYAGLRALGIAPSAVVRMGVPDGATAGHVEDIAHKISPLLKPHDVVVSTWALDGHPDHEAVSEAARMASAARGCRHLQAPVWMWHWAVPGDTRIPWAQLAALPLPDHALHAKQQALACHRSQLEPRPQDAGPVLIPSIVARAARAHEYFFIS